MTTSKRNHLPDAAYTMPDAFQMTMTLEMLKATMLATGGGILAAGYSYNIKSKRLCPGVYKVYLERKK